MTTVVRIGKTKTRINLELPAALLEKLKEAGISAARSELVLYRRREPRKRREVQELEQLYRLDEKAVRP